MGCFATKYALDHGVVAITLGRSTSKSARVARVIAGVAPDGTDAVIAHTRGAEVRIPVAASGVFVLRDHAFNPPDQLTLTRNGGA